MPKLHLKNKAKSTKNVANLVDSCLCEVRGIPNYNSLRLNQELTKSICVFVEDFVSSFSKSQQEKVDKNNVVIEVLSKAFGLSPDEILVIKSQIEFLVENNLIQKSNILTQIGDFFSSKISKASPLEMSSVPSSLVSND